MLPSFKPCTCAESSLMTEHHQEQQFSLVTRGRETEGVHSKSSHFTITSAKVSVISSPDSVVITAYAGETGRRFKY